MYKYYYEGATITDFSDPFLAPNRNVWFTVHINNNKDGKLIYSLPGNKKKTFAPSLPLIKIVTKNAIST